MTEEKYYLGIRAKGAANVYIFGPFSRDEALEHREKAMSPTEWDITAEPIIADTKEEATLWAEWELGLRPVKPVRAGDPG